MDYEPPEESEEESEGEDDVLPPPPNTQRQRASVSAEAFGNWNTRSAFAPPVYPKTPDQVELLTGIVSRSFMFNSLGEKDIQVLVSAMKGPLMLDGGHQLIVEGDDGDCLYVIEAGILDCTKVIDGVNYVVKTCMPGDLFGELALLYGCPRKASVNSRELSIVWELERETFSNIVMEAVTTKRAQLQDVLSRVPLFANTTGSEVENIIDALKLEKFPYGHAIISQGEDGDFFYIIYEGEVVAQKITEDAPEGLLYTHGVGDYFGELSLLTGEPRAATVQVSSEEAQLLSMDRATFKRLMGSVEEFLQRGFARYGGPPPGEPPPEDQ